MIRQCGVVNNEVIVTNKGKGRSFLLCSWLSTVSQKKLIHNKLILTSGTTVAARSSWSPRPSEALIFHHQYYDFFSLAVFLIGATTLNNTGQNMNFFIHFVYNRASLNGPPSQPSFIPSFIPSFSLEISCPVAEIENLQRPEWLVCFQAEKKPQHF